MHEKVSLKMKMGGMWPLSRPNIAISYVKLGIGKLIEKAWKNP